MWASRITGPVTGLFLALATHATAQTDPSITARRAAQQLEAASVALQDADGARDRVSALTQTIQAYEEGLGAMRQGLRQAAIREQSIQLVFEAKRDEVSRLLGVLQTMQNSPAPLLLLHPSGPVGTARSGMILSSVTPAIQAEAETLRAQLEEVALLRELQQNATITLEEGLAGVQIARTELSKAISDRTDLPRRFTADPERMQALLDGSETLQGFASGLSSLPEGSLEIDLPDFEAVKGALALPVSGTVLRQFNEPDAAGIRRPGLLLATRPLSIVTAPWPATIRYRGPLLDYGNVMIVEPHKDYLVVLAGLGTVYGEVGEVVSADAPLGLMPGDGTTAGDVTTDAGVDRTETLYIELRHAQSPVDPSDWFTMNKD
ncbi:murein hydrolase activator EnvC family protein [Aliiroseovarius sp. YM-037]|uniref:murein hydrolase activator EnvC family protein n=1 Tax=Aliiroseovarius sp. YM-037 TaxID=3341728 RepID=UPI003A80CAF1